MYTKETMERVMNLTYPGLLLINRDTAMRHQQDSYAPGLIIYEPRELIGSALEGGVMGSHRFAILSNRIAMPEVDSDQAPRAIAPGAHFKVLDIYRKLGYTQITLLHLPDEDWRLFQEVSTSVDDLLVEYSRKHFDASIEKAPAEALMEADWRRIAAHLVGMTDLGMLFPLEAGE